MEISTLAIVIIFITAATVISFTRKSADATAEKPKRIKSITTSLTPDDVRDRLTNFALGSKFKHEGFDQTQWKLVLSDNMNFVSWGFFYPIYISTTQDGQTLVEVGIVSKFFQNWGPVNKTKHDKCFQAVQSALSTQSTQV